MTFASSFGRVFSPTFQPKSQVAAATSWWLAGGISAANCIAAYQAKGAASYAASKVNLAGDDTYDLTTSTDPAWAADTGWTFGTGTGRYLLAGFSMTTQDLTIASRSNLTDYGDAGLGRLWSSNNNALRQYESTFINSSSASEATIGEHIFILAGLELYKDGSKTDNLASGSTTTCGSMCIGNANHAGARGINGTIQAIAFYNTTITGAQISALNTAMAAL